MQPELAEHGVSVVALSKDTVEQAAIHKARDGLSMTLLSDPKLEVIRQYGVEHHKALNFTTGKHIVGGIPLAFVPSFKAMALPTTLLVDDSGVVQWLDQTDDYRLRSDNSRVLQAVEKAFAVR
jgi:alkyl hydroperoxide reductase subunit AhpC